MILPANDFSLRRVPAFPFPLLLRSTVARLPKNTPSSSAATTDVMDPLGLHSRDGIGNRNGNGNRTRDRGHHDAHDHRHSSHPGFHDVDSLPDPNLPTPEHRSHAHALSHFHAHGHGHGHAHGAGVEDQDGGGADADPDRRSSPAAMPSADSSPSPGPSPSPVATAIPLIDRPRPQLHAATAYVPTLPLTNMSSATGATDRPHRKRDNSGDSSEQLLGTAGARTGTGGASQGKGKQDAVDEQAIFELAHAGKKSKSNRKQHMVRVLVWGQTQTGRCR